MLYGRRMGLGARLAEALKIRDRTQAWLAREAGVDEATISATILRDSKRSEYAPDFARALDVSLHWLLTGEGNRDVLSEPAAALEGYRPNDQSPGHLVTEPSAGSSRYVMIRRLTSAVSAGPGALNEHEEVQDYIAFRRDWLKRKGLNSSQLVVVEVEGESMSPTLESGDIILVNVIDREVRDGMIYAFRSHQDVRVKRFQRSATGGITISSDNKSPRYRDEELSIDQIGRAHV